MDRSSQIDNVQTIVKVIGNNNELWQLLFEREVKEKHESSVALTNEKIEQVSAAINSWLQNYKDYLYNFNNGKVLTIMALNKCMGYSFEEIDKLHNGRINRENYEIGAEGLKAIYEEMLEHSYREQERQERVRCEAEKKLRLIVERKEKERQLEEARQESARRKAEKRTLIRSLRE